MPTVSLTLEDTNRTILNNAYFKIINDVVEVTKIPHSVVVAVHKDIDYTLTDNKTNVTEIEKKNLPSTASLRRIRANISEEYNEDSLTTTPIHQVSAFPIFEDRDIGVFIFPIYVKSDVTIEFNYFTPSKTEANRIRDDIRIRLSQTRNIGLHDIEYTILIPEIVEDFIEDVYKLKNRLVPQSLENYFRSHSTKRMHLITDMANKENTRIGIYEKQVRIVGLFDFNSMPEKVEADNENGNYRLSFSYKLSFEVPRAIGLRYPVMICNKLLPQKYFRFIEDAKINSFEERKRNLGYTWSLHALSHFEAHRQLENRIDINYPINVPAFDDFNVRQVHKGYVIIASFLTEIDETDKRTLLNLKEIDPYYIPDKLTKFLTNGEYQYISKPYMSFLYVGVHQEDTFFDFYTDIDSNLTVRSVNKLSLMKPVRVTLSMIIDLTMLDKNAINRLFNKKDILLLFIAEWLESLNNFKTEFSRTFSSMDDIYRIFIFIFNNLKLKGDDNTANEVVKLLKTNSYLYEGFMNNITTDLQDYIARTNINDYGRNEITGIMKTVLTNHILALRVDKQDNKK